MFRTDSFLEYDSLSKDLRADLLPPQIFPVRDPPKSVASPGIVMSFGGSYDNTESHTLLTKSIGVLASNLKEDLVGVHAGVCSKPPSVLRVCIAVALSFSRRGFRLCRGVRGSC